VVNLLSILTEDILLFTYIQWMDSLVHTLNAYIFVDVDKLHKTQMKLYTVIPGAMK